MSDPLQNQVYTDFHGLSKLKANAGKNARDPETLKAVASQFEALFVNMMMKSMREANLADGIFDSEQTKTYQGMYDQQMSLELSKGKGLGLADMLVRQLGGGSTQQAAMNAGGKSSLNPLPSPLSFQAQVAQQANAQPATTDEVADGAKAGTVKDFPAPQIQTALHHLQSARRSDTRSAATTTPLAPLQPLAAWKPDSPQDFVRSMWAHARDAAKSLGTKPEVVLAQAVLETGWGKSMHKSSSNNLFGIKADARWDGQRVSQQTLEFRDGAMRHEKARFRAYATPAESFADYASFLKNNPRYAQTLEQGADPVAFARGLQKAGYATDPDYARKIIGIMNSDRFRQALEGVKSQAI